MKLLEDRQPPPLWKVVVIYYAIMSLCFAVLGVIAGGGNPLGAVTGLGIFALSHLAVLGGSPPMTPTPLQFLLGLGVAVIGLVAALRFLRPWWRIGLVVCLLLAWLGVGLMKLGAAA